MNINVRVATEQDHASIFDVTRLAFRQKDEARLIERIRRSAEYIAELEFVAIHNHAIIGHILYSKVLIGTSDCNAVALAPMSVLPTHQKQGIGSILINHSLIVVEKLGFDPVIVLGHPEYYPRFGFKRASRWGIKFPQLVPDDVFMALSFTTDGLEKCKGTVKYSPAFGISENPAGK